MEWKLAVAEHLKHRKWKKDSMLLATKANIAHEVVASVQRKLAKAFASDFFPFSPSNTQGQVEQILVSVTSQPMAVVESSSRVQLFVAPWTAAHQASPSFTISQSLPKFLVLASVIPSSHLILWHCLLLRPSIFPSFMDFSNESSVHIRWPKYWNFSFSISPSGEYSGLISVKIDCFDFLAVQGTLRILLQHHSLNASILWLSAFFMLFLPLYVTTGKTLMLYNILFYTIYYATTLNKAQVIDLKMKTNKCKVCVMIVA